MVERVGQHAAERLATDGGGAGRGPGHGTPIAAQRAAAQVDKLVSLQEIGSAVAGAPDLKGAADGFQREQERSRQLRLMNELARKMSASPDPDGLFSVLVKGLIRQFGYAHAAVYSLDRRRGELVQRASAGGPAARHRARGQRVPLGEGLVGWVAAQNQSALVNDTAADLRIVSSIEKRMGALMATPIRTRGRAVGVLCIGAHRKWSFGLEEMSIAEGLADQIGVCLQVSRLYQQALGHLKGMGLMLESSVAAMSAADLNQALASTVEKLVRGLGVTLARIALLSDDSSELVIHAAFDRREGRHVNTGHRYLLSRVPLQRGPCAPVGRS